MDKDHNGRIDCDEFVRYVGGTRAYSISNNAYGGHDPFHKSDNMKIPSSSGGQRPSPPKTSPPRQHNSPGRRRRDVPAPRAQNQGYVITENIARRIWEDAVRKLGDKRTASIPFRFFMVLTTIVGKTVYPSGHPLMISNQNHQSTPAALKLLLHNHVLPTQDVFQKAAAQRSVSVTAQRHLLSMNTSTLLWESFLRYTVRGSGAPYLIDLNQFVHWLRDISLLSNMEPVLDTSSLPIASYTRIWPQDVPEVKPYLSRYRDSLRKLYYAFVRERRSKAKQRALFKHGFSVSKKDTPKLGFGWDDFKKFANLFKICPGLFSQIELRSLFVYALKIPNLSSTYNNDENDDVFDVDLSLGSFKLALIHMSCVVHKKRRRSDTEVLSDRLKNLFTHMWSSLQSRLKRGPGRGISKSILSAAALFCEQHAKRMNRQK